MKNRKTKTDQLSLFQKSDPEKSRIENILPVADKKPVTKTRYNNRNQSRERVKLTNDDPSFQARSGKIIELAESVGLEIDGLIVHDNVNNLASVDKKKNLRLQEIFFHADKKVLISLFRIISRNRKRGDNERVNRYIEDNPPHQAIQGIPTSLLKDCYGPFGRCFDLQEILNEIMDKYTGYIEEIHITWRKPSTGRKSVTWASFRDLGKGGLIRVNALLDNPRVPRYVIESLVFHEILHFIVPAQVNNKKWDIHSRKFNEIMAKFPHHEKAERWKEKYFSKLQLGN